MISGEKASIKDRVIDFVIHQNSTLGKSASHNIYAAYINDYVYAQKTHGGYSENSLHGSKVKIEELIWNFLTKRATIEGYGDVYHTSRPPIVGEFHITPTDRGEEAQGIVHILIYSNGMVQCSEMINEDGDLEYELKLWLPKKLVRKNYNMLADYISDSP